MWLARILGHTHSLVKTLGCRTKQSLNYIRQTLISLKNQENCLLFTIQTLSICDSSLCAARKGLWLTSSSLPAHESNDRHTERHCLVVHMLCYIGCLLPRNGAGPLVAYLKSLFRVPKQFLCMVLGCLPHLFLVLHHHFRHGTIRAPLQPLSHIGLQGHGTQREHKRHGSGSPISAV